MKLKTLKKMLIRLQEKKTLRADGSETVYFRGYGRRGSVSVRAFAFGPFEGPSGRFMKVRLLVRVRSRYRYRRNR